MSQGSALATARADAQTGTGARRLAAAAAARLPAKAAQMTLGQFDAREHLKGDPAISPSRVVWVVTVHGYMATDALPGRSPVVHDVYTDVYDAATGTLILQGIGVAALP